MTRFFLGVAVGGALIVGFLAWNDGRLQAQAQAWQDYEECVADRAGMTPTAYYQKHGYYPECY